MVFALLMIRLHIIIFYFRDESIFIMRRLEFYYTTDNEYSYPVSEHDFLLRCIPQELPEQKILKLNLELSPQPTGGNYGIDSFGNRTYTGRLPEGHRFFKYTVSGVSERDDTLIEKSVPLHIYSYASELTMPSGEIYDFFDSIKKTDNALVQAVLIREAVYEYMEYVSGVTNVKTTATEALKKGQGVCQDFTHIFLALCRIAGIPSRYVSGLPIGEGASHAWAEIWVNGIWHGIDPTRNCDADEKYLKFCTGRDFKDCPIEQGTFLGMGGQSQTVFTKVNDVTGEM